MSRLPWQAPRTAYLLTAAVADHDGEAADALWDRLDDAGHTDVLTALGAQARLAASMMPGSLRSPDLEISLLPFRRAVCGLTFDAFTALLAGSPEPWELPVCAHCRRLLATALTSYSLRMAQLRGVSAEVFAYSCRETAERPART